MFCISDFSKAFCALDCCYDGSDLELYSEICLQVHHIPTKKLAPEIPTPEFVVVDTYERDYSRTFAQPTSYLRARGGLCGEYFGYSRNYFARPQKFVILKILLNHFQLGLRLESLLSMILTMRMKSGFKSLTKKRRFLQLKSKYCLRHCNLIIVRIMTLSLTLTWKSIENVTYRKTHCFYFGISKNVMRAVIR